MIFIYTDGSSNNKKRTGAWAYVMIENDTIKKSDSGNSRDTTNNRMEMMGVIASLEYMVSVNMSEPLTIISDSQYVIYTLTKNWEKRKNQDLWERLDDLIRKYPIGITWSWVKGHANNTYNEIVDKLAGAKHKELQMT